MKDHLIFDTTDANTIADTDSVGAYVRSDDGTLITHHTVGSDEGLDVYLLNSSIVVTATDLDIRDLAFATDSVDVSGSEVSLDAATLAALETVTVLQGTDPWVIGDGGGSITVDATNLDIRDLTHVTDSVRLGDGTSFFTSTTVGSDIGLDVNILNSLTIDADGIYNVTTNPNPDNIGLISHSRAASIGDAQQVERTTAGLVADVAAADISNINAIDVNSFLYAIDDVDGNAELLSSNNSDGGLNVHIANSLTVNDAALANTAIATAANALGADNTAEDLVASPLANRKYLWAYNNGNRTAYVGASGVSAANGFPISPGSYINMRAGAAIDIEWVGPNTSQEMRTMELS